MTIIKAKDLAHVKEYVDSSGTLCTAKHAFEQGKPVFIGIADGLPDDLSELIKEVEAQTEK
jgi:hypothetical protein